MITALFTPVELLTLKPNTNKMSILHGVSTNIPFLSSWWSWGHEQQTSSHQHLCTL